MNATEIRVTRLPKWDDFEELPNTEVLGKIIQTIVRDFNGNTSAYFDSIRPEISSEQKDAEEKEAHIAQSV